MNLLRRLPFFKNVRSGEALEIKAIPKQALVPEKQVLSLYQTAKDVASILEKHEIAYWADFGTLLGAVRHKGLIPWDDDLDFSMLKSEQTRFEALKEEFQSAGYQIFRFYFGYKIAPIGAPLEELPANRQKWHRKVIEKVLLGKDYTAARQPFPEDALDIFLIKERCIPLCSKDLTYEWLIPSSQDGLASYKKSDLFPLVDYPFGSFTLKGPKNPDTYLSYIFGADWDSTAYVGFDHRNLERKKIKLTAAMKSPAEPQGPLK